MGKIFVIGSANTDMVIKSAKLPLPGETILGGSFFMNAGGKGANQAVAASRLGGMVALVAKVGNDIFGKQTIEGLQKENINTDFVFTDDTAPSGTALIMVNEEGENCIAVAPGANANLSPGDIEILKGLFLIAPNEAEASLLTGISVADEKSAAQAAEVLLNNGVQNVIITLGKKGAYFQNKELKLLVNAPVVQALDTTAAGDTFSGALAVALTENLDQTAIGWEMAIQFAVEAASISVTRLGAQASVPYRNEIEVLL